LLCQNFSGKSCTADHKKLDAESICIQLFISRFSLRG
jgi:hypothetical protein